MNPNAYFLIYSLVVASLLLLFLKSRKSDQPTRLNLKNNEYDENTQPRFAPTSPVDYTAQTHQENSAPNNNDAAYKNPGGSSGYQSKVRTRTRSKELNVIFNYNGHSFDAYEILGVPAGSSLQAIEEAFMKSQMTESGDEIKILTAAYHAIVKKQG